MSNPAVITLDKATASNGVFKRFVVEDNIGESIHLHIDNMRIDFTINEYIEFSDMIRKSLEELDFLYGYDLNSFDEHFLKECSHLLTNLVDIKIEEVKLSDLKCIVNDNYGNNLNLQKVVSIDQIHAYNYLTGKTDEFLKYNQHNYFNIDNEKRLLNIQESIKLNGYPYQEKYIILFNGQNYVRDGQHRASVLAHLNGLDSTIKIMRFYFKGKGHLKTINKTNTYVTIKWFLRKIYRKIKSFK